MTYYLNTEKTFGLLAFLLFFFNVSIAQVGINTTSPNANSALDVNGRVIVQDLSRTGSGISGVGILLVEQDGTLIKADLDSDLISIDVNHEITINNSASQVAKEKIVLINLVWGDYHALDIDLNGANSDATVFIIRQSLGGSGELKIRGIVGGTDGRKIKIINDSNATIKFEEDHNDAASGDKIYIYTQNDKMKNYGACELIYSTDISNNGHWCVVQLDKYQ